MYINFTAYKVMITWMCLFNLGRRSPEGDLDLSKSTDVTTRHIRFSSRALTMTS